jgi:amino acid transporter
LARSGSIGLSLIVWTVSGLLSLLGALAFAELSAVVPRSGAEYAYFLEAFGPLHSYFGQLPAFVCAWVFVFVLRPAEVAVIILTFAEYFVQPISPYFGDVDPDSWHKVMPVSSFHLTFARFRRPAASKLLHRSGLLPYPIHIR